MIGRSPQLQSRLFIIHHACCSTVLCIESALLPKLSFSMAAAIILFPLIIDVVQITMFNRAAIGYGDRLAKDQKDGYS